MTALALAAVLVATAALSALWGAWCMARETCLARADAAETRAPSSPMAPGRGAAALADAHDGDMRRKVFDDRPVATRFFLYVALCLCLGAVAHVLGAGPGVIAQTVMMGVATAVLVECDLRWFLLPDAATGLMALAAFAPIVMGPLQVGAPGSVFAAAPAGVGTILEMAWGGALGGGLLLGVRAAFSLASGREALGLGDVKLAAALGAILGAEDVLMTIVMGAGATAALLMVQRWRARGETPMHEGAPIAPLGAGLALAGMMIHLARLPASA